VVIDGEGGGHKLTQESAGCRLGLARGVAAPAEASRTSGRDTNGRGRTIAGSSTGCGANGRDLATLKLAFAGAALILAASRRSGFHGQTLEQPGSRHSNRRRRKT